MKKNRSFIKVLITVFMFLSMILPSNIILAADQHTEENYQNLFNKNDMDNWLQALSYNGEKLVNSTNYENMFTTHRIDLKKGDTVYWGLFGKDQYVMELYDAQDQFLKRVFSTEIETIEETSTVIGVANKQYTEVKAAYRVEEEACAYARIIGNISTMKNFMVFKNLPNGLMDWPDTYIPYHGSVDEENPLLQKSALFVGDSIVNAVKDEEHPYFGWAGRIGTNNDMNWVNAGVSSATISTALPNNDPDNRVITQLNNHKDEHYDFVILQGGMNDSIAQRELGEITDTYSPADFNVSTFSGAMEELLYTALRDYKDSSIGFIITYATPNSTWGGDSHNNAEYFERAKQICEKWKVSYIDLFKGGVEEEGIYRSFSEDILRTRTGENLYRSIPTEIHLGSKGYDVISPYLANWMKTLKVQNTDATIRIGSYNIAAGRKPNIEKMNAQLKEQRIDVAGVQEVDYFNGRNNFDMLKKFQDLNDYPYYQFQKAIDYNGGAYGIGSISQLEIQEASGGALNSEGISEARAWQRVLVEKGGKTIAIYNTHLTHENLAARERQMREVLSIMDQDPCPYKALTGDFNVDQSRKELYPLLEHYNIANGYQGQWFDTYNLVDDEMKVYSIDNIVTTRNLRLRDVGMVESNLSDHNLFYAEFEFLEEAEPSKQLLDMLLDEAKSYEKNAYTSQSFALLQTAIQAAEDVTAQATQKQINAVVTQLQDAIAGLKIRHENLALHKTVHVSGTEVEGMFGGELAVDGEVSRASRWSAAIEDEQWLEVDLGSVQPINEIVLKIFAESPEYNVYVSADGEHYDPVLQVKDGSQGDELDQVITFDTMQVRYIKYEQKKLWLHHSGTHYGSSLYEIEAYSDDLPRPILYYNFNDQSAADQMHSYDGTLVEQAGFTSSMNGLGQALDVSQGGYVQLPDEFQLGLEDFTIAFYVKAMEEKNDTVLFANKTGDSGKDDGFAVMNYDGVFGNAGYDGIRYDTSAYDRDHKALDGSWRHVVISAKRDGSLALYVDGMLSNENTDFQKIAGQSMDTGQAFVLGAGSSGKYHQRAYYDEVKAYNKALTAEEIKQLYMSYQQGASQELQAAMALLTDANLSVPLGADQEMKKQAITKDVKKRISSYKDIEVKVEPDEKNQYVITLSKAEDTLHASFTYTFQEKETLTIASYNIYGWGYPSMAGVNEQLKAIDADIAGLQEANHKPAGGGQVEQLAAQGDYPYSAFKEGYGSDTIWGGSTLVSKYPLNEQGGANYEVNDSTNRSYVRSVIQVGDKKVALYNTHIVWLQDPQQYADYKAAQIKELVEAVAQDDTPYKIITGDFNADQSTEELDPLLLQFNSANGWNNHWLETCEKDASMKIGSVDQIFTTTNMEFVNIGVADGGQSDHDILYAEVKFKEEASLPRQLLDNALLGASTYLDSADRYEEAGIHQLEESVMQVKEHPATKDTIYPDVQTIRTAIQGLVKKMEPIKDPVLYYTFDDQSATDSMGHYDGTLKQNPAFINGYNGKALETGTGYIEISKALQLGKEDFSLSFWFQSKEQKQDTVIFANKRGESGNAKGFFLCNYDGLFANVGTGSKRYDTSSYDRDQVAMDGDWHYITVSADRSNALSLYVDGVLSSSNESFQEIEDMVMDTEDAYVIGAGSQGGFQQKAAIDEFQLYDVALSNQQVAYMYKQAMQQDSFLKKQLLSVIEKTEALLASDQFITLAPNVKAMLQVRLREAKVVYEDPAASDDACLEAWKNLADALHYADFQADKTVLKALIDTCEQIDTSKYAEGVAAFEAALANAKDVYQDNNVLQESIDAAYHTLAAAKDLLKEKPTLDVDKRLLSSVIDLVKQIEQENYLHNGAWDVFTLALQRAEMVFADKQADQAAVDQAVRDLLDAYENIRLVPKEELLKQLEDFINLTNQIHRSSYTASELAMIDDTVQTAKDMLANKDFDEDMFDSFAKSMGKVTTLINEKESDHSSKQLGHDNHNQVNQGDKIPGTKDTTNTIGLFLWLLAGAAMMFTFKRRNRNEK